MEDSKGWAAARRQWLITLVAYSIALAPVGCAIQATPNSGGNPIDLGDLFGGGTGGNSVDTSTAGFFINDNFAEELIAAARSSSADALYVYGDRDSDGNIVQIESILVQAEGQQGFIAFEQGRPVHMQAPNGSYVHVTYTTVTNTFFDATVELFDAVSGATQSFNVLIDLEQTLEQVAAVFEELTGERLAVENLPTDDSTAKSANRSQLRGILIASAVGLLVGLSSQVLGQVLQGIYNSVTLVAQAALVSFFGPIIWISEIMGNTINRVQEVPISTAFDSTPEPPIVIVQ